jgi:ribosomal protein S18 acetylase RimI-like enzyme
VSAGALATRPLVDADRVWAEAFLVERWGSARIAAHGVLFRPAQLDGFVAELDGERVGLATYAIDGDACELVTIDAVREGAGVGTALVESVADAGRAAACARLVVTTTNENERAQAWYARRGFALVAVHAGAVDRSRATLKPEIPLADDRGVPIRDELEYERPL